MNDAGATGSCWAASREPVSGATSATHSARHSPLARVCACGARPTLAHAQAHAERNIREKCTQRRVSSPTGRLHPRLVSDREVFILPNPPPPHYHTFTARSSVLATVSGLYRIVYYACFFCYISFVFADECHLRRGERTAQ